MLNYNIPLRPHHSLCIQNFHGLGYSEDFVSNMKYIINILERDNPHVRLVVSTDILCRACPNNHESVCTSCRHVALLDKRLLRICSFYENQVLLYSTLKQAAKNVLQNSKKFSYVCHDCSWYGRVCPCKIIYM